MIKLILPILTIITLFSCGEKKKVDEEKKSSDKNSEENSLPQPTISLKDLYFMEGNWVDASGTMPGFNEKWIIQGDTLIQVIGYFVTKKDTSIMEAIKVKMIHGNLHYIPKIENQNNGAEIPYELGKGSTQDSLIFYNQEHDFPQIINYVKKSNDSILVYLSGMGEDKKPVEYVLQLKRSQLAN